MTYTTKTLAEHWVCNTKTVRELINNGLLKAFKIGTEWRISSDEVKKYEEESR